MSCVSSGDWVQSWRCVQPNKTGSMETTSKMAMVQLNMRLDEGVCNQRSSWVPKITQILVLGTLTTQNMRQVNTTYVVEASEGM